jgi:DNA (cytosine-5)-methyltransferase 1
MENVTGMATKRDASGALVLDKLYKLFATWGFPNIASTTIKFEEHGVPQLRRRILVVASVKGVDVTAFFPLVHTGHTGHAPPPAPLETLLQRRKDVVDPFYWMTSAKALSYSERHRVQKSGYIRFVDTSKPALTLRAGYAKSRGAECLVRYDDGAVRMLTELECARIQGFGDTYTFKGARTHVYKQIGNAVAPPVAESIGHALKRLLV